jgi:hypothetical protein
VCTIFARYKAAQYDTRIIVDRSCADSINPLPKSDFNSSFKKFPKSSFLQIYSEWTKKIDHEKTYEDIIKIDPRIGRLLYVIQRAELPIPSVMKV